MSVGDVFEEARTLRQADFDVFATLSGDDNPIHVDPTFSARTRFGATVAHGMLLYACVQAAVERWLPGYLPVEQRLMFPSPTFADEPVTIHLEVVGVTGAQARVVTRVTKADGSVGLDGEVVLRQVPVAGAPA